MASTEYALNTTDWTNCGASDDCTLQIPLGTATITFTAAAASPGAGVIAGLRLSTAPGDVRSATVVEPGLTIWARSVGAPVTLTVER